MKIKALYILLIIILIFTVGCNKNDIDKFEEDKKANNSNEVINLVKVIIDGKEYIVDLEDNDTVRDFVKMLPQELNLEELNGNEKYIYLDKPLPTNSYNPNKITAGDIMLYDNDCLVIFYKSFNTSYSYTKIGHINNLPNLGSESIKIKFEKI